MPKGNRQLNETITPEDANLWDQASENAKKALEQGGRADKVTYDNSKSGLEVENVQDALDETSKQISSMAVVPKATAPTQIIISNEEMEDIRVPFAQAKAKPVTDFLAVLQIGKWEKTVTPYPNDLIFALDFENDSLIPKVGNIVFTDSGTTSTSGYWDKGRNIVGKSKLSGNGKIITSGAHTRRLKVKLNNLTTASEYSRIWGCAPIGSTPGFRVEFYGDGGLGTSLDHSSGNVSIAAPASMFTDYDWHEIVINIPAGTETNGFKLYVDGELIGQATPKGTFSTNTNDEFGQWSTSNTLSFSFDEAEVYMGTRTPADFGRENSINLHYKNPTDVFFPQQTVIRRSADDYPETINDGDLVYQGLAEEFLDETADTSVDQYYSAFGDNGIMPSNAKNTKYEAEPGYLMLYDLGDECIDAAGGLVSNFVTGTGAKVWTQNANNMYFSATYPSEVTCRTNNPINITSEYKSMKCRVVGWSGHDSIPGNYVRRFGLWAQKDVGVKTAMIVEKRSLVISDAVFNLDISGVEPGLYYPGIWVTADGGGQVNTLTVDLIWLEKEDNWQEWLRRGGLNPANYTSLDAVVSDQIAMTTLAFSDSAVDYMVTCTGSIMGAVTGSVTAMTEIGKSTYAMDKIVVNEHWTKFILINPNAIAGLDASNPITIPTMTSNAAPSGIVRASSSVGSDFPWFAFDKTSASWQSSIGNTSNQWVEYQFTTSVWAYFCEIDITDGTNNRQSSNHQILASDDGVNYEAISDVVTVPVNSKVTVPLKTSKRYLIYRDLNITNSATWSSGSCLVKEITIRGK